MEIAQLEIENLAMQVDWLVKVQPQPTAIVVQQMHQLAAQALVIVTQITSMKIQAMH